MHDIETETIKLNYFNFIEKCKDENGFKLTPKSDATPFGLCFAIFGYNLIQRNDILTKNRDVWGKLLKKNILDYYELRKNLNENLVYDKPYLQLLTFTLSALSILDLLDEVSLEKQILQITDNDITTLLTKVGAHRGLPKSGNFSMFYIVLLIHCKLYLKKQVDKKISDWIKFHLKTINDFGFWGNYKSMSHLQFQNGYHQYEILKYLEVTNKSQDRAITSTLMLADRNCQFAPYVGGGSCYDYDATYILTLNKKIRSKTLITCLENLHLTLKSLQNPDGGFCESKNIRPLNLNYFKEFSYHIYNSSGIARYERLRQMVTLMRPKYNKIDTHWSKYSRKWEESSLWDSWFRLMSIAKIEKFLSKDSNNWNFIDYPGIGYSD